MYDITMSLALHLHQSHHQLGDFKKRFEHVEKVLEEGKAGLHLFPELHLTGYPLQDLCLHRSFIKRYKQTLEEFKSKVATQFVNSEQLILCGGLEYDLSTEGVPRSIRNVIYRVQAGREPVAVYTKMLLPNYDIFDERKYFTPGEESEFIDFNGKKIGLMICEDMWPSLFYKKNPVTELKNKIKTDNIHLDAVINLSASPYTLSKRQERLDRAMSISNQFQTPFAYVNLVGGEDEILFDGDSFVVNGDQIVAEGKKFKSDVICCEVKTEIRTHYQTQERPLTTWEELLNPALDKSKTPYELQTLSQDECEDLVKALTFGLQEYAQKSGFKKFVVALSGGIDSAVVLALTRIALENKQSLEAVYMPSKYSAKLSQELALEMCQRLDIPYFELPITKLHAAASKQVDASFEQKLEGLADENIQSRLRGTLLYTRSNQTGAMVINTSNKSELAVGYSTQYGDSVGAISLLGDVYKSEVYQLAHYINHKYKSMIPAAIIERAPSAELREDQKDSDSLPPYEVLDAILEAFLSYSYSVDDLVKAGFKKKDVDHVWSLYKRSEYKRRQFCPILKVKAKSFGFGYRMPLTSYVQK